MKKCRTIMAIVMVAMLAFGGTYAYFTATAEDAVTSGLKSGVIVVDAGSSLTITDNKNNILPTETFEVKATVTNEGATRASYIFVQFEATTASASGTISVSTVKVGGANATAVTVDGYNNLFVISTTDTTAELDETTGAIVATITYADDLNSVNGVIATGMGADITVKMHTGAIQQVGFGSPEAAFAELAKESAAKFVKTTTGA